MRLFLLSIPLSLYLSACVRGTDHERMGDRRYAEHSWPDAVAEYRLAARQHHASATLQAKLANAAMHNLALGEAAEAWRNVSRFDPTQRDLASEGLLRTAHAAIDARDIAALRAAVAGLRETTPERLAELGAGLFDAMDDSPNPQDADLSLSAAATSRGVMADSLMSAWGDALAAGGRCDLASRAWDGLRRRNGASSVVHAAKRGLAGCLVQAGRAALSAGQLQQAEASFRSAIDIGMPDTTVRRAWLLIGDARWAGGDSTTAAESYRKAIAGGDDDSPIVQRARQQLQKLTGSQSIP